MQLTQIIKEIEQQKELPRLRYQIKERTESFTRGLFYTIFDSDTDVTSNLKRLGSEFEYLADLELPVLFVLTKADKLSATQRQKAMKTIPARLQIEAEQVLPVSAHSGDGIEDLLETIGGIVTSEE